VDKWAKQNGPVLGMLIAAGALIAFIFLSKADAASTYATKPDLRRLEDKVDRILELVSRGK
jgi:hypothetical protein